MANLLTKKLPVLASTVRLKLAAIRPRLNRLIQQIPWLAVAHLKFTALLTGMDFVFKFAWHTSTMCRFG